ncbi:FKS1 [Symbiodinium pilosum]|uniref:FKS1 protein n=1 Tax=Symbiodinium pilosum TaxID=2952 RepID=A0A812MNB3_SYMPI|nr:FKS1 [Symbiodinium pilosum]
MFTWALVLASDCDGHFEAFESSCARRPASELMGRMLASIYTLALLLLVLLATALPLFMEQWMQRSFKIAVQRLLKQVFTLSFLMFVFQAKIIGFYVINELRYGGAKYISTGRSLPTERRHFIRAKPESDEFDGLYLDYAMQAFYDGLILLIASVMVVGLGGMSSVNVYRHRLSPVWVCIGLTIISWLYAPFIFNPHQFARRQIEEDRRSLCAFFFKNCGRGWIRWYEECQLKPRTGLSISMLDFNFLFVFLGVSVWFAVVNHKVSMLQVIFSKHAFMEEVAALTLLPPVVFSMVFCMLATLGCSFTSCIRRSCKSTLQSSWDQLRILLPALTPVVMLLQIAEAALCLDILRNTGRWKDYIAGFILKYLLLEVMIYLAEGLLRSRCARGRCCQPAHGLQAVYFWVLTNRMFRDMITSTVIIVPLLILSYFNSAFRRLCSSFDLHEFLIYRSTGHRARRRSSVCGDSESEISEPTSAETGAETSSSDEAAPLPVRAR